ncbi:hypothetical protein NPIL_685731, partial [Nephila pilipes]
MHTPYEIRNDIVKVHKFHDERERMSEKISRKWEETYGKKYKRMHREYDRSACRKKKIVPVYELKIKEIPVESITVCMHDDSSSDLQTYENNPKNQLIHSYEMELPTSRHYF